MDKFDILPGGQKIINGKRGLNGNWDNFEVLAWIHRNNGDVDFIGNGNAEKGQQEIKKGRTNIHRDMGNFNSTRDD